MLALYDAPIMKKMPMIKRFYADRYLHIRSFSFSLIIGLALCFVLYQLRAETLFSFQPSWWHLALIPTGLYVSGISAVWIHNATHGSFKNPYVNELCGQIAGMHQLWGFDGWKLIHLLHHMYSDDSEHDTHPPKGKTFWQFAKTMFTYSSACVSKRYREHFGNNLKTQFLQRAGLLVFFSMAATNLTFWFLLLGAEGFVFFWLPSYIANYLVFVDINYSAHPADPVTGETVAANLNNTPYYKLANALWFGIYFHGNHHRKPMLFNPRYIPIRNKRSETEAEIAA